MGLFFVNRFKYRIMKFLLPLMILVLLSSLSCGKKAVEIDPEWAKEWTSSYFDQKYKLIIKPNGRATFINNNGSFRGFARIKQNTLTVGRGKFLITQYPTYFGPPLNRWSIEVNNIQYCNYP